MGKKVEKPRMGRPPLPADQRKRPSMAFRPTLQMRRKLDEAAAESGRSLAGEIMIRLERSFWVEDQVTLALSKSVSIEQPRPANYKKSGLSEAPIG